MQTALMTTATVVLICMFGNKVQLPLAQWPHAWNKSQETCFMLLRSSGYLKPYCFALLFCLVCGISFLIFTGFCIKDEPQMLDTHIPYHILLQESLHTKFCVLWGVPEDKSMQGNKLSHYFLITLKWSQCHGVLTCKLNHLNLQASLINRMQPLALRGYIKERQVDASQQNKQ